MRGKRRARRDSKSQQTDSKQNADDDSELPDDVDIAAEYGYDDRTEPGSDDDWYDAEYYEPRDGPKR